MIEPFSLAAWKNVEKTHLKNPISPFLPLDSTIDYDGSETSAGEGTIVHIPPAKVSDQDVSADTFGLGYPVRRAIDENIVQYMGLTLISYMGDRLVESSEHRKRWCQEHSTGDPLDFAEAKSSLTVYLLAKEWDFNYPAGKAFYAKNKQANIKTGQKIIAICDGCFSKGSGQPKHAEVKVKYVHHFSWYASSKKLNTYTDTKPKKTYIYSNLKATEMWKEKIEEGYKRVL